MIQIETNMKMKKKKKTCETYTIEYVFVLYC